MFTVWSQDVRTGTWSQIALAETIDEAANAAKEYALKQPNCILKIKDFNGDVVGWLIK